MTDNPNIDLIPLVDEKLNLQIRTITTGQVNVNITTTEEPQTFRGELSSETVTVEHIPIDKYIDEPPAVRQDGDVTVYPVVQEVLVKRLLLREEVRVTRVRRSEPFAETTSVRRQTATVERTPAMPDHPTTPAPKESHS